MFLASDAIKRYFGAHTESQESSSLPVAKHFLRLCLAKRRLNLKVHINLVESASLPFLVFYQVIFRVLGNNNRY